MSESIQSSILQLAREVGQILSQQGYKLVTAESCTGGGLGQAITAIAGSSKWYERGFITYSNLAKQEMLGVNQSTLNTYGAVSEQSAKEMMIGALNKSHAQIAASITGIAGPNGGTEHKPVGTVYFAWGIRDSLMYSKVHHLNGDRISIRDQSIITALEGIIHLINQAPSEIA